MPQNKDNFNGDGQSTLLFTNIHCLEKEDLKFLQLILTQCKQTCRSVVSGNVEINIGDSVKYLIELMKILNLKKSFIVHLTP